MYGLQTARKFFVNAHRFRVVSCFALLGPSGLLHAAVLGGYEVQSALGQPLRMVVQITTRADEVIEPRCFKLNPSTDANDGLPQLTGAQVTLDRRGNQQRLLITSARAILDPIVRVSIDVGCDTTLRRDLTLLLDPLPVIETQAQTSEPIRAAASATAQSARLSAVPGTADDARASATAAAAPGNAAAAADTTSDSPTLAAPRAATRQVPAATTARPARAPGVARRDATPPLTQRVPRAAERQGGAQARIRPPPPVAAARDRLTISNSGPSPQSYSGAPITPRLTLSTSLADRTGAPPLSESALSILRQKQARLKAAPNEGDIPSLEAELVVLQKQTAEVRNQLDAVLAELRALQPASGVAGGVRAAASTVPEPASAGAAAPAPIAATPVRSLPPEPPGGYWNLSDPRLLLSAVLGGLLLLVLVGLCVWWWRQRAERGASARWNKSPYVPVTAPSAATRASNSVLGNNGGRSAGTVLATAGTSARENVAGSFFASHAARDVSVSDLAQATEKASVFATLGRPGEAIDVLRDHVDHEPKPSPMAWLMLLDLYRQTGRRADFDDVAQRFHNEFNTEIPAWTRIAPGDDPGLAAFPRVVGRIRDEWPTHEARSSIEELLYDNRGGSRLGFSLAAFRDLLLLHGLLDDHLAAVAGSASGDAALRPPAPPVHLAGLWNAEETSAPESASPSIAAQPRLELDVGLLTDAEERSALETGYPIIAEAITVRWGKPGAAGYLKSLIRSTDDQQRPSLSLDTIAELILLHDVARELGDSELKPA